jgi:cytochrome c oxidase subunit 2
LFDLIRSPQVPGDLARMRSAHKQVEARRARQLQAAPPPATPDQVAGQQLFLSRACVLCHAIGGTIAAGVTGPDLTHVASRPTLAAGTLANTPANLKAWIQDPTRFKPGVAMPKVPLSERELNQLVAYLGALK